MNRKSIEIEIDPKKMIGVYEKEAGYVSGYDGQGKLLWRRAATSKEVIDEIRHREIIEAIRSLMIRK